MSQNLSKFRWIDASVLNSQREFPRHTHCLSLKKGRESHRKRFAVAVSEGQAQGGKTGWKNFFAAVPKVNALEWPSWGSRNGMSLLQESSRHRMQKLCERLLRGLAGWRSSCSFSEGETKLLLEGRRLPEVPRLSLQTISDLLSRANGRGYPPPMREKNGRTLPPNNLMKADGANNEIP